MADILALGISHYPPLSGHDERMAAILQRMCRTRTCRRICERRRDGRRACGGNGARIGAPLRPRRIVPPWSAGWSGRGPPWMRSNRISFCSGATISTRTSARTSSRRTASPPMRSSPSPRPDNVWGRLTRLELPGNRNAAKMLATRLIEQGFDTATRTSRSAIRSDTPSPTRSSTSITIGRAFIIPSCRSR